MKRAVIIIVAITGYSVTASSQQQLTPDTELWSPEPSAVTPGIALGDTPSDAVVLFDGKSLSEWSAANDSSMPAKWIVENGIMTVNKKAGDIQTKRKFIDYQLHIEWRIPENITGQGQSRGNSGIILASAGMYDFNYELQVLDSYQNKTYVNGQAGAIYKQYIPLANASKKPGEWQSYDIAWTAPRFNDGVLKSPAVVTVFYNNILIQNNVTLREPGNPDYKKPGPAVIKLQAHGDPSEPLSYRNIWIRPL